MEYRILGPLEIRTAGEAIPLPRRRERVLLAALLLRAGEVVSADSLIEAGWGATPPRTVVGSLQNGISELRKALGSDVVVTRPPGYLLAVDRDQIDAMRFERARRQAASEPAEERAKTLADALALWRGPALADLADEPFARTEAMRLDELRIATVEDRVEADLELGVGADLVAELEAHVAANPVRERLRGQLMLALYRAGRQAEALDAYRETRRALVDGLGIEPSQSLQELERRMLRQDPSLLPQSEPTSSDAAGELAVRKTVTVLAAALEGSAASDPELLARRVERFLAEVRTQANHHGGVVDRFLGSEAVVVFGADRVHEDDPLRAVRAAAALREALLADGETLRIGVATGEVVVRQADAPVIGDVVRLATALRELGDAGDLVVADATFALVDHAVVSGGRLAGSRTQSPVGHRIEAVRAVYRRPRRLDTPFVGRDEELGALRDALGRATGSGRCVAITVMGEAGIGKSRLAEELVAGLVRGRALVAATPPYGETSPLGAASDLVRQATDDGAPSAIGRLLPVDEDGRHAAQLLATLMDTAATIPRGEAFWALRAFLAAYAAGEPLVVVLDDLHWADAAVLDLVDYLVARLEAPVLLLCLARLDVLDGRPDWAGASSPITAVTLGPLADDEVSTLLGSLRGGDVVDDRATTIGRAGGNPLYLEQLAALARDTDDRELLTAVPPTIDALLHSRLDALPAGSRAALQRAAVAGHQVTRGVIVALSEPDAPVDAALLDLTRRELLETVPTSRDDAFQFHHVLLRDVAYDSLPRVARAELHERAADWLDRDGTGPDDTVGWHLERAFADGTTIGAPADHLRRLADLASSRLGSAALREWRVNNVTIGIALAERAVALQPLPSLEATRLSCELALALRLAGRLTDSTAWCDRALEQAMTLGAPGLAARARLERAWVDLELGNASSTELESAARAAIDPMTESGDARGLGRAWLGIANASFFEARYQDTIDAARTALVSYDAIGYSPGGPIGTLTTSLLHGPTQVGEGIRECEELFARVDDRAARASILSTLGALRALEGAFDEANELTSSADQTWTELGLRISHLTTGGLREMRNATLSGRHERAESIGRECLRRHRERGSRAWIATIAASLAATLTTLGRIDEAQMLVDEADAAADARDVVINSLVHATTARIVARRGDFDRARAHARRGIDALAGTDGPEDHAVAWVAVAEVERLSGETAAAAAAEARMAASCEAKGAPALLAALQRDLAAP